MTEELRPLLDHTSLSVDDLEQAKRFYEKALAPLGIVCVADMKSPKDEVRFCGFGIGRKGSLWLVASGKQTPPSHICFRARSRDEVDAFYKEALAAGGTCNGKPGTRPDYHPEYYAAFVRDLEGHNIEAVTFN